ncbi:16S rRNA (cytidine(1402)-2'-O)-methyltransferase [Amylibacter sp. IMCC11727]|uniref:16S rRNA (cytidine(1402)-2'-O)-methyltransferase n=1 Tax=Amylibacter sp. IMCC11727 TaxID=3039851 RepID=UPI00244DCF7C|nr:16S rRNA (cytidine(1402)-2'-O)-methyltransferase [Amylibacter sp. IMCC11727]WGI21598.1 16S rRNA (cytidine(1402)-2'-O)-methyltransferase [Amylibacter sp. IMCC11727]
MGAGKITAGLHIVATPIGAARDITLRSLDILAGADVLAAEDTRNTRRLLEIHGIKLGERRLLAYHDHNGAKVRPQIIDALKNGASVAYVSDAGTPMVADPGFDLSRAVIAEGLPVFAAPGASAVLAALCVSGQPSDRFFFAGFAPNKSSARQRFLQEFALIPSTMVFYESPKRIVASLKDMIEIYGAERPVSVCRELTKKFEEVVRGTLQEVLAQLAARESIKGEIVIVLGPPIVVEASEADIDAALEDALKSMRTKDAASDVATRFGLPRKEVYARALVLGKS